MSDEPKIINPFEGEGPVPTFKEATNELRKQIRITIGSCAVLHQHPDLKAEQKVQGQFNETHAQVQLAYRDLESAMFRLGMAIKAMSLDNSISVP